MILLDGNGPSELNRPKPSAQLVAWLEAGRPLFAVPTIALEELRYGISRPPAGQWQSSLLRFWRMTCEHFRGRIFSFDERAAGIYTVIATEAEHKVRHLNNTDGQVAPINVVHGMQIAIRNVSDSEAASVSLVNPWD